MSPNDANFLWHALGRLLLAVALGAVVGLERETHRKPAGLRTIILITFGSALFTLMTEALPLKYGGEPFSTMGHLIQGIGFLGAGAIIQSRGTVVGLTTAATIFAMATVGIACGGGAPLVAVLATFVLLGVLVVLGWVEKRTERRPQSISYVFTTTDAPSSVAALTAMTESPDLNLREVRVQQERDHARVELTIEAVEGREAEALRKIRQACDSHA